MSLGTEHSGVKKNIRMRHEKCKEYGMKDKMIKCSLSKWKSVLNH